VKTVGTLTHGTLRLAGLDAPPDVRTPELRQLAPSQRLKRPHNFVRRRGIEPLQPCGHWNLKGARELVFPRFQSKGDPRAGAAPRRVGSARFRAEGDRTGPSRRGHRRGVSNPGRSVTGRG
jgi:hypothetical protein